MTRFLSILALTLYALTAHAADVVLGRLADLTWAGTGSVRVASFSSAVLPDVTNGVVSWWKMDEGTGATVADATGGTNTLSLSLGAGWTNGVAGSALRFPGTNGVAISVSNTGENSTSVTISAWVWVRTNSFGQYIVAKNNSITTRGLIVGFQSGHYNIYNVTGYPTGSAADTQMPCTTGTWQHVVYASNGSTLQGYVDGVLVVNRAANLNGVNANGWRLGQYTDGNSRLNGAVDEVRIYNRALSSNEVFTIWNKYKP